MRFTHPCGQAHLSAVRQDDIALVIWTLRVVAFVVCEQREGVGLWCVVAHGFWVKGLKVRVFDWDKMFKVVVLFGVEPIMATMRVKVSCGSQVVQDAVHDADVDAKYLRQFGGPVGLLKQ